MNGKIKIGILIANDFVYEDAKTAKTALNTFEKIFDADILDIRFNESSVRVKDGLYLTDDYFNDPIIPKIRKNYGIDIVLIITNRTINNWQGDGGAIWGEANTLHAVAMLTTWPHPGETHADYIEHTAIHEVLHILGYVHPVDFRKCIMRYATTDYQLCDECRNELPYHVVVWRMGTGHDNGQAFFLINMSIYSFFAMLFVTLILVIRLLLERFIFKGRGISPNPLILGIGILIICTMLASSIIASFYPRLILIAVSVLIYVIFEAVNYGFLKVKIIKQPKKKKKS
jgi:predicted Zn-dependent protease with MMP-like domain